MRACATCATPSLTPPTSGQQRLTDALLARLGVSGGARDDIALIAVRLDEHAPAAGG